MADDTTLRLRHPTGADLYTQIEGGAGIWDGSAYVDIASTTWAAAATATPETPGWPGRYVCQFPTGSPPGNYSWSVHRRAGPTPASTDAPVGVGVGYWDGATFGGASKVTEGVEASLPTPAPAGYGPIGTGSRLVDQDYPTAGNLAFTTAGGAGIGGALVLAYLASEYAAGPNAATVRGQTLTLDTGGWANVIGLDPGTYTIVFKAEGYETTVVPLTVS